VGNADRLAAMHAKSLRYCPEVKGWFGWNGARWARDEGLAPRLAIKTVRAIGLEAKALRIASEDDANAGVLWKFAIASEAFPRLRAMLEIAKSDPRLVSRSDDFDQNPWLLNVRNGTIKLRTGQLLAHDPTQMLTKMAPVDWDPDNDCPRWKAYLASTLRPEVIPYLQRAIGYTLTGSVREECVFVLLGAQRNGKGTLIKVLDEILGDYACVVDINTFLASGRQNHQEDIADMRGSRLVSAHEPPLKGRYQEGLIKTLSGGDRIPARRLYEHRIQFYPHHKLWITTNRSPLVDPTDGACWARLHILPFDVSWADSPDTTLKEALYEEREGILAWAVEGCLKWQELGLQPPACVRQAKAQCQAESRRSYAAA
jgi:putative DNA primase/helicase